MWSTSTTLATLVSAINFKSPPHPTFRLLCFFFLLNSIASSSSHIICHPFCPTLRFACLSACHSTKDFFSRISSLVLRTTSKESPFPTTFHHPLQSLMENNILAITTTRAISLLLSSSNNNESEAEECQDVYVVDGGWMVEKLARS